MPTNLTPESVRAWRDTPDRRSVRQAAFSACLFSEPTLQTLDTWRGHEIWKSWVKEDNRLTTLLLACLQPIPPDLILPFLLEHGLDVRARTSTGEGALHLAANGSRKHRLAWCRALIQAGAELDVMTHKGHSPLLAAANRGAQEIIDELLAHGMFPSPEDQEALFQTNHAGILTGLWERTGMRATREERTLHCLKAAQESRWNLVRAIMPYGIDIHRRLGGETLLLMARRGRKFPSDVVEELVYLGADPEDCDLGTGLNLRQLIQKHHGGGSEQTLARRLRALDKAITQGAQRRLEEALPQATDAPAIAPPRTGRF